MPKVSTKPEHPSRILDYDAASGRRRHTAVEHLYAAVSAIVVCLISGFALSFAYWVFTGGEGGSGLAADGVAVLWNFIVPGLLGALQYHRALRMRGCGKARARKNGRKGAG